MSSTDHLALATEALAIAESDSPRREAYKRAAEHIAAHKEATGDSDVAIAIAIGRGEKGRATVERLRRWRHSGYKAETPFKMDEQATTRAAKSHAKQVLRDPEQRKATIEALAKEDPGLVAKVATAAIDATDAKGVRAISSAAINREMDDSAKARKDRKGAKAVTSGVENPGDPNKVERRRFGQRLSKINADVRDLLRWTLETEWTEQDAEVMLEAIAYHERLTERLKEAVFNADVDWDEALAALVDESNIN